MKKEIKELLVLDRVSISFTKNNPVVKELSFSIKEGEILGIVGESGSGKTMSALAIMGLLNKRASTQGSIIFDGKELNKLSMEEHRKLKGKEMAMIFQEPMTSFNPLLTIGTQLDEVYEIHKNDMNSSRRKDTILSILKDVGLENGERIYSQYPHELSGGMRQRAMIAMAMILKPKLLIADEPTTALDVTVQKKILELMKSLNEKYGTSIILISHDLGVIHSICHRMLVMKKGEIVERGNSDEVFSNPKEDYTKELLSAIPRKVVKYTILSEEEKKKAKEILNVKNLNVFYGQKKKGLFQKTKKNQVVYHANFSILEGETLGIVGESGSGKSTIAKAIVGLNPLITGDIQLFVGKPQMVFQDPYSSLNPVKTVNAILEEPLILAKVKNRELRKKRLEEILCEVGLSRDFGERYIHQLSGGQRQRIAIGVALIQNPRFIVLDEPVSALDVTIQAQIIDLLIDLQKKHKLTYLFISHDLNLVYQICNKVCIMKDGHMIEYGDTISVLDNPKEEYTKDLLNSVLSV